MAKVYPPSHPLGSASLKVKRANMHYYGLVRRMKNYVAANGPEVILRPKGEIKLPSDSRAGAMATAPTVYEIIIDPRYKDIWALIIGDIIHNLHQALDHIAWALATEHARSSGTPIPPDKERFVSFPLRDTPVSQDRHTGGLNWNDLQFFPPASFQTIEQFQPYHRANRPEAKVLWALNNLANLDKHRIVTPVFTDVAVKLTPDQTLVAVRLNKPDQSMFLAGPDLAREFGRSLNPIASYEVQVSTGLPHPDDFIHVYGFRRIHRVLRDEVIPAFAGFFP